MTMLNLKLWPAAGSVDTILSEREIGAYEG
jgi:hypothetical protein